MKEVGWPLTKVVPSRVLCPSPLGSCWLEQQLVDCATVDSACNGGLMDNGFAFAEKNAMCTEDSSLKELSPDSGGQRAFTSW